MSVQHADTESTFDDDNSVIYTPLTSTGSVALNYPQSHPSLSSIPSDGCTVIIRSVSSGHVITFVDGNVVLAPPGGRGSILWKCVESDGWIGFRNCVTNKFLCHDGNGMLKCEAEHHGKWRHFTITPMRKGGYILQMADWWTLRPVVLNEENGLQKLGRTGQTLSQGIIWEFVDAVWADRLVQR